MDWLGWFVPRFNRRELPPESIAEPAPEDLERLAELRAAGSHLTLPHPVRCVLRLAAEAESLAVAERLGEQGWSCQRRALAEDAWTVTAIKRMVPTPGAITRVRETMTALASEHGGLFLGWQSPPVL